MNKLEDFCEYKSFFESNEIDANEFIKYLNIVTEHQVCPHISDYTKIIIYLSKIGKWKFFIEITDSKSFCNFKALYLYFKFLLLEPKQKNKIFNDYISEIANFKKKFANLQNPKDWFEWTEGNEMFSLQEIMECIYKYMNDEFLENFMDCFDVKNEYVPLNTQEMSFIEYNKDKYLTLDFYFEFNKFVICFQKLKFLYNLNYCLSNMPSYQSMSEYECQVLSGMEDFCKRFHANSDKFIMLYNYQYYQYINCKYITRLCSKELDSYVEKIKEISCNDKIIGINTQITKQDKEYCTRKLFYNLFDIIAVSEYVSFLELNLYIEKVIEYKKFFPSDDYKLLELVKKDPFDESQKLKNLYDYTFDCNVFVSLLYLLSNVYKKLLQIKSLNQEEIDFKKYLENLFENTYNFTEWHDIVMQPK